MKLFALFLFVTVAAFAQHTNTLTWTWTQGTGQPATSFAIYQAGASGGCAQPINASTCAQVGTAASTATTFTTSPTASASNTADPLVEGQTYCYVVVAQGTGGIISGDSNEQCVTVKKTLSAPTLAPILSN